MGEDKNYKIAFFGLFLESVKNREGNDKVRAELRKNIREDVADGVLAYMVMQEEARKVDQELEKLYIEAKIIAESLMAHMK